MQTEMAAYIKAPTLALYDYCESRNWAGIDPYDALNSRLFEALHFLDRRIPRLILTQLMKRSVLNIRPLLLVPHAQNPKALGLFLMSALRLSKLGLLKGVNPATAIIRNLESLRSQNSKYWCWGYSFPWQTRTLLVPRWEPNLVCTTFIADALLDAYEQTGESKYLEMASSSARFILDELYWTGEKSVAGFAYPLPSMRNNVHNGNLLGAALFCRVAKLSGETLFIEPALRVARYSASKQHDDGSWKYGEAPNQQWIDNFHTGYNLCALRAIGNTLGTGEFEEQVRRGFEFYRAHFFREDGAARYFHNQTYPVDIHCVAQSVITLLALKDLDPGNVSLAHSVLRWALKRMWDKEGFFYYRVLRFGTIQTSYMRWSQAWMLLAMSALLSESEGETVPPTIHSTAAAVPS